MERMIKTLAVEYIRLTRLSERMPTDTAHTIALRHSLRRLRAELDTHHVTFLDLTGQTYDAGMALEILDTDDPDGAHEGKFRIADMRQPVILWNGKLLAPGEVLLQAIPLVLPEKMTKITPPAWHAHLSRKRNQRRHSRRRKTHTGVTA